MNRQDLRIPYPQFTAAPRPLRAVYKPAPRYLRTKLWGTWGLTALLGLVLIFGQ